MSGFDLDNDDVVSNPGGERINFELGSTFKLGELVNAVINWASSPKPYGNWFGKDGVRCQVLHAEGGGWRKGRLRFRLEFIPDPEPVQQVTAPVSNHLKSPLDDLRSDLKI